MRGTPNRVVWSIRFPSTWYFSPAGPCPRTISFSSDLPSGVTALLYEGQPNFFVCGGPHATSERWGVRTGASQSALEPIDKGLSALAEGELF